MHLLPIIALSAAITLSGCAATVHTSGSAPLRPAGSQATATASAQQKQLALRITGSEAARTSSDWGAMKNELRAAIATAAYTEGASLTFLDEIQQPTSSSGMLVAVKVNDYRFVSSGARVAFGIFTGNAFVDAQVEFTDLSTQLSLGKRDYNTSSSAWQGVFSPMTSTQIQALGTKIVKEALQN